MPDTRGCAGKGGNESRRAFVEWAAVAVRLRGKEKVGSVALLPDGANVSLSAGEAQEVHSTAADFCRHERP